MRSLTSSSSPLLPVLFAFLLASPGLAALTPHEDEKCHYALEVVILQDVSDSFQDDVKNLKTQIPPFLEELHEAYPYSRFGLASFRDKPAPGVGDYDGVVSHCMRVETPLNHDFDEVKEIVTKWTDGVNIQGGMDEPEAQLDALLRLAVSDAMGWSTGTHDRATGMPIMRIVVLITDTYTQPAGALYSKVADYLDGLTEEERESYTGPDPKNFRQNDYVKKPEPITVDPNAECGIVEYPTLFDVGRALNKRHILPIFLVSPSGSYDKNGVFTSSADTDNAYGFKLSSNNTFYIYSDYAREMGVTALVDQIDQKSSNFREKVVKSITQAVELRCQNPIPAETTPAPKKSTSTSNDGFLPPINGGESTKEVEKTEKHETTSKPKSETSTKAQATTKAEDKEKTTKKDEEGVKTGTTEEPETHAKTEEPTKGTEKTSKPTSKPDVESTKAEKTEATEAEDKTRPDGGDQTSGEGGRGTTTTTVTTEGTEEIVGGVGVGIIVSSAVGGAAAAAVVGGLVYAKKVGFLFPSHTPEVAEAENIGDVDAPEDPVEREAYEVVTADAFA